MNLYCLLIGHQWRTQNTAQITNGFRIVEYIYTQHCIRCGKKHYRRSKNTATAPNQ